MIFDFVVTMGEDENPQDCSFRLWDTVTFRIAHDGMNTNVLTLFTRIDTNIQIYVNLLHYNSLLLGNSNELCVSQIKVKKNVIYILTFRLIISGEVPNGMTTSDEESTDQTSENEPIAIIGMACRLPGSNDYHTFWNNLVGGVDSIGEAPKDRFQPERGCVKMTSEHLSTEARYLSCPVDTFDAKFWGISPLELEYTDPQARMVLQLAWEVHHK